MGTTESKNTHRYRSNKHSRYQPPPLIVHQCQYRDKQTEVLITGGGKKDSLKRKNETIGKREFDEGKFF